MEPRETPARLVDGDRVAVGQFTRPFEHPNLGDAPASHLLSKLRGTPLGFLERRYRRMRLKQWHYTSVVTPDLFFGAAVVDAGYVGTAFAYLVDRKTKQMHEWTTLRPLSKGILIASNSTDGTTSIDAPGWGTIHLRNDSRTKSRRIEAHLEGALGPKGKPPLHLELDIRDDGVDPKPIVVVEQSEPGRWLYTHKVYNLETGGTIRCGAIDATIPMGEGLAGIDWNRGFRPIETYWNWAAAAGTAKDGSRVGFNLTAHRPWDGSPGHELDEDASDCALWLGGQCVKIPRVEFEYDTRDHMKPWRMHDAEGLIDLRFEADGRRSDDVNFGLVVSQFHQPFGRFYGTLRTREGDAFELDDVYGVTEQHYARW